MPSTDELIADFKLLLAQGFSVANARWIVVRKVTGVKQMECLQEALDRLEKEMGDGEVC